jgi:hypothetical protein
MFTLHIACTYTNPANNYLGSQTALPTSSQHFHRILLFILITAPYPALCRLETPHNLVIPEKIAASALRCAPLCCQLCC